MFHISKYIPADKAYHLVSGGLIGALLGSYTILCITVILIVGIGKEVADKYGNYGGDPEIMDAVCTIGAGFVCMILHNIIG